MLSDETQEKLRPALRVIDMPPPVLDIPPLRAARPPTAIVRGESPAEISLPLWALSKFLECPLQGAAQYALGIFEDDDEPAEEGIDEPVAQRVLDRTVMLREAFWKGRGNPDKATDEYLAAYRIAQVKGRAPAGPFGDAARNADRERLRQWIEHAADAHGGDLAKWQEIRIGRAGEGERSDRIVEEISLSVAPPDAPATAPATTVRIYGSAGFVSPDLDAALPLVLRNDAKSKDFVRPFLSAIALKAAGEPVAKTFRAIVVGAGKGKEKNVRILAAPDAEQARAYLAALVTDLLFAKNHYFMPIEAMEIAHKQLREGSRGDLIGAIDDLRDNEFKRTSSDYGPIRNARRFAPPPEAELRRIFARRFGPIRTIFRDVDLGRTQIPQTRDPQVPCA